MPKPKDKPLFDPALLDAALEGRRTAMDVGDLIQQFTKAILERALDAELTHHLGHETRQAVGNPSGNIRNGKSKKTL
uniref:transposase n=1 Tax=Deinococcus apachensis TaxID=309886 RepID=UPI00037324B0